MIEVITMSSPDIKESAGPDTINEAWEHSVHPVKLFEDAYESSNNWLPFGIGFAIDHPAVLASPEFLELAALDPVFRVGQAAWELGPVTAYNMLQDAGSAAKEVVDVTRSLEYAAIDLLTLHPIDALNEVGNGIVNAGEAIGHAGEALLLEPLRGIGRAVSEIL